MKRLHKHSNLHLLYLKKLQYEQSIYLNEIILMESNEENHIGNYFKDLIIQCYKAMAMKHAFITE